MVGNTLDANGGQANGGAGGNIGFVGNAGDGMALSPAITVLAAMSVTINSLIKRRFIKN